MATLYAYTPIRRHLQHVATDQESFATCSDSDTEGLSHIGTVSWTHALNRSCTSAWTCKICFLLKAFWVRTSSSRVLGSWGQPVKQALNKASAAIFLTSMCYHDSSQVHSMARKGPRPCEGYCIYRAAGKHELDKFLFVIRFARLACIVLLGVHVFRVCPRLYRDSVPICSESTY